MIVANGLQIENNKLLRHILKIFLKITNDGFVKILIFHLHLTHFAI